jgi:hypothetical protein
MICRRVRAKASIALLAATAALLVFALPASAAAPRYIKEPASVTPAIFGTATNGFSFLYFDISSGLQAFSFSKKIGEDSEESVSYFAIPGHKRAARDADHIDVRIGKLGHFRGHFVTTSSETRPPPRGCKGDPTTTDQGYFVGSFRFHGERAYTTVHSDREPGVLSRQGATECRIATEPRSHEHNSQAAEETARKADEEAQFRLLAADSKGHLVLNAVREQDPPEPDGPAITTFEVTERGGRAGAFRISRSVSMFHAGEDAARYFLIPNLAEPKAEATLEPPAPFSGSATFRLEGPKAASWTGDLAVELPGLGDVPLTGKKIYAGACRGQTNCTKTLPDRLQPLLEAGGGFGVVSFASGEVTKQTS